MSYPKIVALDTDWTIWQRLLDQSRWGRGRGASALSEDNIEPVDRQLLRDRSNHNNSIRLYNDVPRIVNDILSRGAKLAIVSRNTSKAMCDRALFYFHAVNPSGGSEGPIIHMVTYDEVINQSKVLHFRRIREWSASDYSDMLLFDDEAFNNSVKVELGVAFQLLRDRGGLTWAAYEQGIETWRRAKRITILRNPASARKRALIGYSGLAAPWVQRVGRGEGIVDRTTPYRWGYALYVANSARIARFFRDWDKDRSARVCEVWVKDYDMWASINKIWVPESNGNLPLMNNMNISAEESGRNQEDRDRFIANRFGVQTPYVLFSRHHWMRGMPQPARQRFTEMVVYTQVQRSLFEVVPIPNAQANQITNGDPYPFRHQMKTWNIRVPDMTRQEFRRRGEMELFRLSAP